MIVVLAATDFEASRLRHLLNGKGGGAAGSVRPSGLVTVVRTGVGKAAVEKAVEQAVRDMHPAGILNVGFAGALSPEMKAGSAVLIRRVRALDPSQKTHELDGVLLEWALRLLSPYGVLVGDLVTTPWVVDSPSEKSRLGRTTGAKVVDMEGYWIASAVAATSTPLLALKVISDEVNQRMPGGDHLAEGISWGLTRHMLARPWEVGALPRLAYTAFSAGRALGTLSKVLAREWVQGIEGGRTP